MPLNIPCPQQVLPVTALALLTAAPLEAGVLVVGTAAEPYATIQAAIDAAASGDTVLVRPGSYPSFSIDNKSVTLVGDTVGGPVVVNPGSQIRNLAFGGSVVVSGLTISSGIDSPALLVTDCAGGVRLQSLKRAYAGGFATAFVRFNNVYQGAILNCELIGNPGLPPSSGSPGLRVNNSQITVQGCTIRGAAGLSSFPSGTGGGVFPALSGVAGCVVDGPNTVVLFHGTAMDGGTGGNGLPGFCSATPVSGGPGADGGTGLSVTNGANIWISDCQIQGGAGGLGGAGAPACSAPAGTNGSVGTAISGAVTGLSSAVRALDVTHVTRELAPIPVTIRGTTGDLAWVMVAENTGWNLDLPFEGVRLFEPPRRRVIFGTVGASGSLTTSMVFPDVAPAAGARNWHLQGFVRDASGTIRLGEAAVLTVLDSAY